MTGIATAARSCYWGWKVFQAARLCAGDVSVLVELLAEGCAELAAEEIMCVAIEACELAKHAHDVGKFTQKLSTELATHDGGAEASETMEEVHQVYAMFIAADTDGDGQISRTEFIRFVSELGETRDHASQMFTLLDKNRDGEMRPQQTIDEDSKSIRIIRVMLRSLQ